MKPNDLLMNINYATQKSDTHSLLSKSIARQLSVNATPFARSLSSVKQQPEIRAYKRRFLMIILALLLCISNAYAWISASSISDKLTYYYGISNQKVNLLSIIYFCVYVTCIVPATKLIERKGLRYSIIVGAGLNFLGAIIKCGSVNQDYGFHVALVGQFFNGLACLLIFNIPPEIASTWCKPEEVSRVMSFLVCSCFIGNALAFFIPTLIVGSLKTVGELTTGFYNLHVGFLVVTGSIFILIILFFEDSPPHPPSLSQFYRINAIVNCGIKETTSIMDLMSNRNLVVFIIYSSINAGVFDAFTTLLNQMILMEFPGDSAKVGSIGILFILSGMVGSLFCGYLLDKFHKYKEISVIFYGMSIFFLTLFMFKLHFSSTNMINTRYDDLVNGQSTSNNILLHIYVFGLGFFLIGYWTIRFDFGPELAYPHPASTVCGLTAACCDVAGIIISMISSKIVDNYGTLMSNLMLLVFLLFGMCLLFTLKPEYKRQEANASKPLINNNSNSTNNNLFSNGSYGTLDSKWLERKPLIQSQIPCKTDYSNVCFQYSSPNHIIA